MAADTTAVEPPEAAQPEVVRLLAKALRLLGDAGGEEPAARLAAEAWSVLRRAGDPAAERFTGVLHYLTQRPTGRYHRKGGTMSSSTDRQLDVRQEIPARRHELIFQTWDALAPGQDFVLVNDHDPKPLYYQFAAEHTNAFTWDYLEQGPQVWRVRIGRAA